MATKNAADWLSASNAAPLLAAIRKRNKRVRTATPDRKLRLFAAACCRRVWSLLSHEAREMVSRAEGFADEVADAAFVITAVEFFGTSVEGLDHQSMANRMTGLAVRLDDPLRAAEECSSWAAVLAGSPRRASELAAHVELLRCIVDNPFRPVAFDPAWQTPTVVAVAEGLYADRAFDRLPVLADALEDAGCDSEPLLAHLRGPGPHARGRWPVDLVLGNG